MAEKQFLDSSRLLAEKLSVRILLATMKNPRSAFELSNNLGIPIALCFRKIKQLEDVGLIACVERELTKEGKRVSRFRSNLRNGRIVLKRNQVQARIELFDGSTQEVKYDIELPTFLDKTPETV